MVMDEIWLDYAVDVVTATDHDCLDHGGGCLEPGGEPGLRWPGYIGDRYVAGSLLFVGNVHRDFSSNDTPAWVSDLLVQTTNRLRGRPLEHRQQCLADVRRAYQQGLRGGGERGSWTVARPFTHILGRLGLDWSQVAYTNASKSQAAPRADITSLIDKCGERYPIDNLAARLEVSSIVACSAPVHRYLTSHHVEHRYFLQQGWSYANLDAIAEWCRYRLPGPLQPK